MVVFPTDFLISIPYFVHVGAVRFFSSSSLSLSYPIYDDSVR